MRRSLIPLVVVLVALAATSAAVLAMTRDGGSATDDAPPILSDEGIEALQIDGVWVFQDEPESAMEALHSGTPEIVDGCLVVDNTIVVWHVDRIDEATEAIAAVNAGESPQLLIAGGGISVDEGARPDQIPTVITDRCPTTAVWFAAGEIEPATDDMPPILSDEAIDPDECNVVHNIDACDEGVDESACDPLPLRSDCGIDPNECNLVHNISACTDEELEAGGLLEEQPIP